MISVCVCSRKDRGFLVGITFACHAIGSTVMFRVPAEAV